MGKEFVDWTTPPVPGCANCGHGQGSGKTCQWCGAPNPNYVIPNSERAFPQEVTRVNDDLSIGLGMLMVELDEAARIGNQTAGRAAAVIRYYIDRIHGLRP